MCVRLYVKMCKHVHMSIQTQAYSHRHIHFLMNNTEVYAHLRKSFMNVHITNAHRKKDKRGGREVEERERSGKEKEKV